MKLLNQATARATAILGCRTITSLLFMLELNGTVCFHFLHKSILVDDKILYLLHAQLIQDVAAILMSVPSQGGYMIYSIPCDALSCFAPCGL